jgi:transmembrane sensor
MRDDSSLSPAKLDCDPAVLDRVLARESTPDDDLRLETWCAAHPEEAVAITRLRQGWSARNDAFAFASGEVAVQRVGDRLEQRDGFLTDRHEKAHVMAVAGSSGGSGRRAMPVKGVGLRSLSLGRETLRRATASFLRERSSLVGKIAAVATVLLICAGIGLQNLDRLALTSPRPSLKQYVTRVGESLTITLTDGSRVTLAPQSKLQVDDNGSSSTRAVTLVGEALFEVIATSRRPFTVHSGPSVTRVLGTTFSVRHYSDDAYARIIVTKGKVEVAPARLPDSVLVLHERMVGQVNDSSTTTSRLDGVRHYVDWRTGRLIFHEVPMTDVLSAMHRWYGYRFQLADSSLGAVSITAALDSRSSENAFATIKLLLGLDFTFEGNVVTVRQRRDPRATPETRRSIRDSFTTFKEIGR